MSARVGQVVNLSHISVMVWALAAAWAGGATGSTTFTIQILPGDRSDETIAWRDVNGDGRKDLVRQANRWLEVYFLDEHHHLSRVPDWRVEMAPPWDLWNFADVRPDLPGEELLALSPQGVGWLSWQRHATSTAQMELLVTATLPVTSDPRQARAGQYVVRMAKDRPPDLVLPTRNSMQFWRRASDSGRWQVAEEVPALLRPKPWYQVGSSAPFLVGFGMPFSPEPSALSPPVPGRLSWRDFQFRLSWAALGGWLLDWNHDGRLDWVTSGGPTSGGLKVCLQTPDGRFDRQRPIFPVWQPAPAAEEPKRDHPGHFRPRPEPTGTGSSNMGAYEFFNLADVDGDGRLDVVRISSLENWASPRTHVAVYLQSSEGSFPREPDSTLRVGAVTPTDLLPLVDVDGDGTLDLLLLRIDLEIASLSSQMKAFVRQGLQTYLGAYLWKKGSGFAKRPAWEKLVMIGGEMFDFTRDPQPLMQFDHDYTGDGRPDLVLRLTRNTIGIFPLDPKKGFAEEPMATLQVPFVIDRIECEDFDGDGRNDVLVEGWDPENHERVPRAVFFGEK